MEDSGFLNVDIIGITRPLQNLRFKRCAGGTAQSFHQGKPGIRADTSPDRLASPFVSCGGVGDNRDSVSRSLRRCVGPGGLSEGSIPLAAFFVLLSLVPWWWGLPTTQLK
jgi:hypothetical protein